MRHRITIPPASALWADGGFTVSLDPGSPIPHARYLASEPGREARFPARPTDAETLAYVRANLAALTAPGAYFGGWHDSETGAYFLDVTRAYADRAAALDAARAADQRAVYDSETGEDIRLARTLAVCMIADGYVTGAADVDESPACTSRRYWDPDGSLSAEGFAVHYAESVPPRTAADILAGPGGAPDGIGAGIVIRDGYDWAGAVAPFLDADPFLSVEPDAD